MNVVAAAPRRVDRRPTGPLDGVPAHRGLDAEPLAPTNPGLTYGALSRYRQSDAYANKTAFDGSVQAISGAMRVTGEPAGRRRCVRRTSWLRPAVFAIASIRKGNRSMKFNLFVLPTIPATAEERERLRPIGRNNERFQEMIRQMRELAVIADQMGFATFSTTEHHLHSEGFEASIAPLMFYNDLAARTENIKFASLGLVLPTWDPIRVAEEIAVLDHLTKGRFIAGFARGYQDRWSNILGQHYHVHRHANGRLGRRSAQPRGLRGTVPDRQKWRGPRRRSASRASSTRSPRPTRPAFSAGPSARPGPRSTVRPARSTRTAMCSASASFRSPTPSRTRRCGSPSR